MKTNMAEKLSDIVAKIKSGAMKGPKPEMAKPQMDFDMLFDKHSKMVCPDFTSNKSIEYIKAYFLALSNGYIKKGLYVYGNVGVGKSTLIKIFRNMGKEVYQEFGFKGLWFSECTAPWLVNEKMASVSPGYDGSFDYDLYTKGKLYIDDLGMESLCFNNYELMSKLLFERHRNDAITFISSNMAPTDVLHRYGPQIFDRMGQMFHIVKWEGKSLRP